MDKTVLAIVAIVAASGLAGVVVVESISITQQQAEAAKSATGQCASFLAKFKNGSTRFCPHG
jgi:hypothetical protein